MKEKLPAGCSCSGVVLAGGNNTRLPGKKKGLRCVGEEPILDVTLSLLSQIFDEVILVVNEPRDFCRYDALVVRDMIPGRCPLAGLYTGLFHASNPWIYACACDMPFVSEAVIRHLLANRKPGKEIIVPRTREGQQPLSALYNKSCLPLMRQNLEAGTYQVKSIYRTRKVWDISPEVLDRLDPGQGFCFNINTPEDLILARSMARSNK